MCGKAWMAITANMSNKEEEFPSHSVFCVLTAPKMVLLGVLFADKIS
jgi:hypothetical protein